MKSLSPIIISAVSLASVSNASFIATPKDATINVYKNPMLKSKIIATKNSTDNFKIEYCNKYKWCKLENNDGFIKEYQINKISKSTSKFVTKKEQLKIENLNKVTDITKTNEYKIALDTFKNKKYQKSFLLFEQLLEKYPSEKLVDFYYGRSAFELKNYEYAFTSFDRILINHPTDARVRAEFARTLMMMKSYKDAKKEFEAVLLMPIPQNVRKNIEKMIQVIEAKEKNYVLNKVAIIGFGWDDNINNNTYLDQTLYGSIPINNNTTKLHDTFFNAILVGNLIVPNKKNNKITWETMVISYMQEQSKYKDNNIQLLSFSTGIGQSETKGKNLFSLTYDHIWIGGTQTLYIYGVTNSLNYKISKSDNIKFDLKFKNKKFIDPTSYDKNSRINDIVIDYTKTLKNKKDKIVLSTSYSEERKIQGSRTDVDKNTNKYKIAYNKNFLSTYDATLGYEQELTKYLQNSFSLPKREDDKKTFSSKLSYKVDKKKVVSVEYKNTRNKSNINSNTYKKQTINVNYTLIF